MSVPRVVWLLWLQGWASAPWLAQQVVASWRFYNPGWEVRLVDSANISLAVDISYLGAQHIAAPAKSDVARVSLLAQHGGVWADASMLCLAPLDGWIDEAAAPGGMFMYHSGVSEAPCSWFIAARADSYVMRAWRNATDAFWARTNTTQYAYFWMDQLFMGLLKSDAVFASEWAKVPFSDCTKPNGAPATLHGRHGLPIDAPLLQVFITAPPNTVKLSIHGSPLSLTAAEEKQLPNTTSNVAVWFSRLMRSARPVGKATLAQLRAGAVALPSAGPMSNSSAAPDATHDAASLPAAALGSTSLTVAAVLARFGADVRAGGAGATLAARACSVRVFGSQYGGHALCVPRDRTNSTACFYMNYGIEQDFSFDTELSAALGCAGVALDPTVTHPSELVPNVFFLKLGAPSLETHDWQVLAPTRLWAWHNRRPVFALKYDCEGCEYALARAGDSSQVDELRAFLQHTHQLNIELHLHTTFLDSTEKLANLAELLTVLHDVGMRLIHVAGGGCGRDKPGVRSCRDEVYEAGLPCEGADCSSFLFAKV